LGTTMEKAVLGKVTRRLIPFLFLLYIFNYLDRVNVSIAALTMKPDLGLSDAVYGLGAGIFFLGYFLFEVPSNLILERVGARVWMARIMLTWGLISSGMMFVKSPVSFYAMRFLLGAAEAGFFPGMILYLSYWFPATERARAISRFMSAIPLSTVLGGPLSGALLKLNGVAGLKGWQWIFLVEGVPSVLLGVVTLFYLTNRPEQARWLLPTEREWLTERLRREQEERERHFHFTLGQAFVQPRILILCALGFAIVLCNYGLSLWAPLILKSRSGWSDTMISTIGMAPSLAAGIVMLIVGAHSDRTGERRWHLACAAAVGAAGLVASVWARSPILTLVTFSVALAGICSAFGPFWALSTSVMSSVAAAGAIAFINSVSGLGGFVGPMLIGSLRGSTGADGAGLYTLASGLLLGGVLALLVRHERSEPAVSRMVKEEGGIRMKQRSTKSWFHATMGIAVAAMLFGSSGARSAVAAGKITIAWAQWKPSDDLQRLALEFTQQTGIAVDVQQIPWTRFEDTIENQVWPDRSAIYDLIVGDSQWLGRAATEGRYLDLTDWSNQNVPWSEIAPAAKRFYCEYNGKIWAVPCEGDAQGVAYRRDLFEDPAEKAAFKTQYGYDLAPPQTWLQFRDVAEFFTRPDRNLYGAALLYAGSPDSYDDVTMGFDPVLWSFGGALRNPDTGQVEGVANSAIAAAALQFYAVELKKCTPPGSEKFGLQESVDAFRQGRVAMAVDWYSFFPALTDPAQNPLAARTGFFLYPAGPAGRFIQLGGQGMSISAYSKQPEEAKAFLAWFSQTDTQQKWARMGGLTSNNTVLMSAEFRSAAPFNELFAQSVPYLRDFYNAPEYRALLASTQKHWHAAVTGEETPQQAVDAVANEHRQILSR
jgi:ACS family tartrate transporter-like MFS transporter